MHNIVFIPGVWDMLHFGHIKFLERASKFGDIIIVGVESDELIIKEKGRPPIISLKDRILALEALRFVDIVVPFYEFDYVSCIRHYSVNVFVLSEKNKNSKEKRFIDAIEYLERKNKKLKEKKNIVIYLPYSDDISSTKIKDKVLEISNPWKYIWDRVGCSQLDDITVVSGALTEDKIKMIASYITNKLNISQNDKVLDYGCGSGMLLKHIDCQRFGIDISEGMIKRATKNCLDGIFLVDNHISFRNKFDHVICYGVLHYLQSINDVTKIIDDMKNISKNILIMELPDIDKKDLREKNRDRMGKAKYPEQLYFDKQFFIDRNFTVFDNEISLTNNSDYGFTALIIDNMS